MSNRQPNAPRQNLVIRAAHNNDIDTIMQIYHQARQYMRRCGNRVQWVNGYPQTTLIADDIAKQHLYVMECDGVVHAVFAFIVGDDATYQHIEGNWINNNPYGTVHRLASDGTIRKVLHRCVEYCFTIINNIRLDTHEQNYTMRSLIDNEGFTYCGVIYVSDGTPRLAFQKQQ